MERLVCSGGNDNVTQRGWGEVSDMAFYVSKVVRVISLCGMLIIITEQRSIGDGL